MSGSIDIIDLTKSFTLAHHYGLSNVVIDLLDTDDSFCIEADILDKPDSVPRVHAPANDVKPTIKPVGLTITTIDKKILKKRKNDAASPITEKKKKFGGCPICWEELGKNPLASTKCGHVYCISCIQEYLKYNKKCPTCRRTLKGSSSYHPLYLG